MVMKLRANDVVVTLPVSHEVTNILRIENLSGTFLVIWSRWKDVLTTLRVGNVMVIKLRACDVVVTLSIGKSRNYQKLPIRYVTVTSCVSRVLLLLLF